MGKPFVYQVSGFTPLMHHFNLPPMWTWHCANCDSMGYMEANRIDVFDRAMTHACPDLARTVVARLPISGNWYWECARCNRIRILTNFHAASQGAHAHAASDLHNTTRQEQTNV